MLTIERLREVIDYDPATGLFAWRIRRRGATVGRWFAGDHKGDGYLRVKIDGKNYRAHRLAWFWNTGAWPLPEADHIDGNARRTEGRSPR